MKDAAIVFVVAFAMAGLIIYIEHIVIRGIETRLSHRLRVRLWVAIVAFVCVFAYCVVAAVLYFSSLLFPAIIAGFTVELVYFLVIDIRRELKTRSTCMFFAVVQARTREEARTRMPWAIRVTEWHGSGSNQEYMGFGSLFLYRTWKEQAAVVHFSSEFRRYRRNRRDRK